MKAPFQGNFFLYAGAVALLPAAVWAAVPSSKACLSYWQVGASGCDGSAPAEEEIEQPQVQKLPTEEPQRPAPPPSLDQRVDEFLENYEKPPREFVEFNLEPSLENALKWVTKYNETLRRNSEITSAWEQAEKIYKEAAARGEELPGMVPATALPEVPSFSTLLQDYKATTGPQDPFQVEKAVFKPSDGGVSVARQTAVAGRLGGQVETVNVTYFFSAGCEQCKKQEEVLAEILQAVPMMLTVDCVNTTPAASIPVGLACQPRAPLPGEEAAYGIKTTPSLLVLKEGWNISKRISGYINFETLKNYLLEK